MAVTVNQLLNKISQELIENELVTPDVVKANQKQIRNGQVVLRGVEEDGFEGTLVLYQNAEKANEQDLQIYNDTSQIPAIQSIADSVIDESSLNQVTLNVIQTGTGAYTITIGGGGIPEDTNIDFIVDTENNNPLNVSQFVPIEQKSTIVDPNRAEEYLDTNIYELLPTGDTRQARINRFFQELNALLPPFNSLPEFDLDGNSKVDRDEDGNWINEEQYDLNNSIVSAQNNPTETTIDEEDAFIHRLSETTNDTNSGKTIEDIYETILPYLTDILEAPVTAQDDRPVYENQSSGYLQFRNLNQGIIIRNTDKSFVEGLDPENRTYLTTGFTITMWVRFLDKVSEGTLFNFGNPTRDENPFGFKLETYILNKDDLNPHHLAGGTGHTTWGEFDNYCAARINNPGTNDIYIPRYENSNYARYVRLVVEDNGILRDSHTGVGGGTKRAPIPIIGGTNYKDIALAQTTFIPEDFNEWYFICASFNPNIDEPNSYPDGGDDITFSEGNTQPDPEGIDLSHSTNYWLNHINPSTTDMELTDRFVNNSGYGNKCKVEIISRSDLLRARGFKV